MNLWRRNTAFWLLACAVVGAISLPGAARAAYADDRYEGRTARLSGRIRDIDRDDRSFTLISDNERITIDARDADILDRDGRTGRNVYRLQDLRRDERVSVEGRWLDDQTVRATVVRRQEITGYNDRSRTSRNSSYSLGRTRNGLTAVVMRDTGKTDRDLQVEVRGARYTVEVPRGTRVTRDGRPVSVHELKEGDIVRVQGDWRDDQIRARRVDASSDDVYSSDSYSDPYEDSRSYSGTVERLNRTGQTFRLRTRTATYDIDARDADVLDNGRARRLSDLREGDDVRVYVSRERGRTLIARRIELGYGSGSDSPTYGQRGTIGGTVEDLDFLNRTFRLRTGLAPITVRVPSDVDLRNDRGDRIDFRDLYEGARVRVTGARSDVSGLYLAERVDLYERE